MQSHQQEDGGDRVRLDGLSLTESEIARLITSLSRTRGDSGFTEEDIFKVMGWAVDARIAFLMLEAILQDDADIVLDKNGDVRFTESPMAAAKGLVEAVFGDRDFEDSGEDLD